MSGNFLLDTNNLVYLLDPTTNKQSVSQRLVLAALRDGHGMISTQLVQEFLNPATGKFAVKLTQEDTRDFLQKVLLPLCQIYPDIDLYTLALDVQVETRFSFYDSLIPAAAIRGNCETLFSEDLHSGQKVRGVEIVNPYLPDSRLPQ